MKRKEHTFVYFFTAFFLRIAMRVMLGMKIEIDPQVKAWKKSKKPFIMLCTHPSELDAAVLLESIYPRYGNIVAGAQQLHDGTVRGWLFRKMNCIPKMQFVPDINAVRSMMNALKAGHIVGFMPEGRVSMDGTTCFFDISTAKFIKKMKVPVAVVKPENTFHVCSSYGFEHYALGKIGGTVVPLCTAEEADELSVEELYERMKTVMAYNQFENLTPASRYGRKKGVHMKDVSCLYYYCPECGAFDTITDDGKTIRCTACGAESKLERSQLFTPVKGNLPADTAAWNKLQVELEEKRWSEDPKRELSFPVRRVERGLTSDKPFEEVSTGTLSLTRERLLYTDDNDGTFIEVPADQLAGLSADYLYGYVVLYQGGVNRRLYTPEGTDVSKLINSITALRHIL